MRMKLQSNTEIFEEPGTAKVVDNDSKERNQNNEISNPKEKEHLQSENLAPAETSVAEEKDEDESSIKNDEQNKDHRVITEADNAKGAEEDKKDTGKEITDERQITSLSEESLEQSPDEKGEFNAENSEKEIFEESQRTGIIETIAHETEHTAQRPETTLTPSLVKEDKSLQDEDEDMTLEEASTKEGKEGVNSLVEMGDENTELTVASENSDQEAPKMVDNAADETFQNDSNSETSPVIEQESLQSDYLTPAKEKKKQESSITSNDDRENNSDIPEVKGEQLKDEEKTEQILKSNGEGENIEQSMSMTSAETGQATSSGVESPQDHAMEAETHKGEETQSRIIQESHIKSLSEESAEQVPLKNRQNNHENAEESSEKISGPDGEGEKVEPEQPTNVMAAETVPGILSEKLDDTTRPKGVEDSQNAEETVEILKEEVGTEDIVLTEVKDLGTEENPEPTVEENDVNQKVDNELKSMLVTEETEVEVPKKSPALDSLEELLVKEISKDIEEETKEDTKEVHEDTEIASSSEDIEKHVTLEEQVGTPQSIGKVEVEEKHKKEMHEELEITSTDEGTESGLEDKSILKDQSSELTTRVQQEIEKHVPIEDIKEQDQSTEPSKDSIFEDAITVTIPKLEEVQEIVPTADGAKDSIVEKKIEVIARETNEEDTREKEKDENLDTAESKEEVKDSKIEFTEPAQGRGCSEEKGSEIMQDNEEPNSNLSPAKASEEAMLEEINESLAEIPALESESKEEISEKEITTLESESKKEIFEQEIPTSESENKEEILEQEKHDVNDSNFGSSTKVTEETTIEESESEDKRETESSNLAQEKGPIELDTESATLHSIDVDTKSENASNIDESKDRELAVNEVEEPIELETQNEAPIAGTEDQIKTNASGTHLTSKDYELVSSEESEPIDENAIEKTKAGTEVEEENQNKDLGAADPLMTEETTVEESESEDKQETESSNLAKEKGPIELDTETATLHSVYDDVKSENTSNIDETKDRELPVVNEIEEPIELETQNKAPIAGTEDQIKTNASGTHLTSKDDELVSSEESEAIDENAKEKSKAGAEAEEDSQNKELEAADPGSNEMITEQECASETVTREESQETIPETNQSKLEESMDDFQNKSSESVEQKSKVPEEGQHEIKEKAELKLETEDHAKETQNEKETVKSIILTEEVVPKDVEKADGDDAGVEPANKEEDGIKELQTVPTGHDSVDNVGESSPISNEELNASNSNGQEETVNLEDQGASEKEKEVPIAKATEEQVQDETSEKHLPIASAQESEEIIKEVTKDEDSSHDKIKVATSADITADTSLEEGQIDEKAAQAPNNTEEERSSDRVETEGNQEENIVSGKVVEESSSNLDSQPPMEHDENMTKEQKGNVDAVEAEEGEKDSDVAGESEDPSVEELNRRENIEEMKEASQPVSDSQHVEVVTGTEVSADQIAIKETPKEEQQAPDLAVQSKDETKTRAHNVVEESTKEVEMIKDGIPEMKEPCITKEELRELGSSQWELDSPNEELEENKGISVESKEVKEASQTATKSDFQGLEPATEHEVSVDQTFHEGKGQEHEETCVSQNKSKELEISQFDLEFNKDKKEGSLENIDDKKEVPEFVSEISSQTPPVPNLDGQNQTLSSELPPEEQQHRTSISMDAVAEEISPDLTLLTEKLEEQNETLSEQEHGTSTTSGSMEETAMEVKVTENETEKTEEESSSLEVPRQLDMQKESPEETRKGDDPGEIKEVACLAASTRAEEFQKVKSDEIPSDITLVAEEKNQTPSGASICDAAPTLENVAESLKEEENIAKDACQPKELSDKVELTGFTIEKNSVNEVHNEGEGATEEVSNLQPQDHENENKNAECLLESEIITGSEIHRHEDTNESEESEAKEKHQVAAIPYFVEEKQQVETADAAEVARKEINTNEEDIVDEKEEAQSDPVILNEETTKESKEVELTAEERLGDEMVEKEIQKKELYKEVETTNEGKTPAKDVEERNAENLDQAGVEEISDEPFPDAATGGNDKEVQIEMDDFEQNDATLVGLGSRAEVITITDKELDREISYVKEAITEVETSDENLPTVKTEEATEMPSAELLSEKQDDAATTEVIEDEPTRTEEASLHNKEHRELEISHLDHPLYADIQKESPKEVHEDENTAPVETKEEIKKEIESKTVPNLYSQVFEATNEDVASGETQLTEEESEDTPTTLVSETTTPLEKMEEHVKAVEAEGKEEEDTAVEALQMDTPENKTGIEDKECLLDGEKMTEIVGVSERTTDLKTEISEETFKSESVICSSDVKEIQPNEATTSEETQTMLTEVINEAIPEDKEDGEITHPLTISERTITECHQEPEIKPDETLEDKTSMKELQTEEEFGTKTSDAQEALAEDKITCDKSLLSAKSQDEIQIQSAVVFSEERQETSAITDSIKETRNKEERVEDDTKTMEQVPLQKEVHRELEVTHVGTQLNKYVEESPEEVHEEQATTNKAEEIRDEPKIMEETPLKKEEPGEPEISDCEHSLDADAQKEGPKEVHEHEESAPVEIKQEAESQETSNSNFQRFEATKEDGIPSHESLASEDKSEEKSQPPCAMLVPETTTTLEKTQEQAKAAETLDNGNSKNCATLNDSEVQILVLEKESKEEGEALDEALNLESQDNKNNIKDRECLPEREKITEIVGLLEGTSNVKSEINEETCGSEQEIQTYEVITESEKTDTKKGAEEAIATEIVVNEVINEDNAEDNKDAMHTHPMTINEGTTRDFHQELEDKTTKELQTEKEFSTEISDAKEEVAEDKIVCDKNLPIANSDEQIQIQSAVLLSKEEEHATSATTEGIEEDTKEAKRIEDEAKQVEEVTQRDLKLSQLDTQLDKNVHKSPREVQEGGGEDSDKTKEDTKEAPETALRSDSDEMEIEVKLKEKSQATSAAQASETTTISEKIDELDREVETPSKGKEEIPEEDLKVESEESKNKTAGEKNPLESARTSSSWTEISEQKFNSEIHSYEVISKPPDAEIKEKLPEAESKGLETEEKLSKETVVATESTDDNFMSKEVTEVNEEIIRESCVERELKPHEIATTRETQDEKIAKSPEDDKSADASSANEKSREVHSPAESKLSLFDMMQRSTRQPHHAVESEKEGEKPKSDDEEAEKPKSDEEEADEVEEDEEHEGEEQKKNDSSGSDAPVMVEACKEMEIKSPNKKSHGILSGVGSKVKHSISKVKKAITGSGGKSSSHTKQQRSPK